MEQLTVRDCDHPVRHTAACLRRASPAEILAAAANLDGAIRRQWHEPITVQPKGRPDLGSEIPAGRWLLIPLPDKETPK